MADTITIHGSHGQIVADRLSGHIVRADACDCADCLKFGDYRSIAWFDPARWPDAECGSADILLTAPVYADGTYQRECSVVETGDPMMPDYYLDELPLLPAPASCSA